MFRPGDIQDLFSNYYGIRTLARWMNMEYLVCKFYDREDSFQ